MKTSPFTITFFTLTLIGLVGCGSETERASRTVSEEADSPSRLEARAKPAEAELTRNKQGEITEIKLRVFNRQITDAEVEDLKGLTELVSLQLMGDGITDAVLEHLKELPNLTMLDLSCHGAIE